MIDVFVRISRAECANPLRSAFYEASRARWAMEGVHLCELREWDFPGEFIRSGRLAAEKAATTELYIVTDSDVLIVGKDWVKRGIEAMCTFHEFAICSSLSLVEGENLAKPPIVFPQGSAMRDAPGIYEMHAVGAPMWIRKGIIKEDLPELTLDQECGIIHKYVLDKGYKEGLINGLRHNHLGHGFSSNPALHWGY